MWIFLCQRVYIQPQRYFRVVVSCSVVIQSSLTVQLLSIKQIRHGFACAVFLKQHFPKRNILRMLGYSSLSIRNIQRTSQVVWVVKIQILLENYFNNSINSFKKNSYSSVGSSKTLSNNSSFS